MLLLWNEPITGIRTVAKFPLLVGRSRGIYRTLKGSHETKSLLGRKNSSKQKMLLTVKNANMQNDTVENDAQSNHRHEGEQEQMPKFYFIVVDKGSDKLVWDIHYHILIVSFPGCRGNSLFPLVPSVCVVDSSKGSSSGTRLCTVFSRGWPRGINNHL